jgi:hypothetical protein
MPFRSGGKQVAIRNLALQQRRPGLGRLRGFRGMGCGCRTSLGQDPGDVFSPNYDPLSTPVISMGPVYGPPALTPADVAYNQTVTAGSTPNPAYAFQPLSPSPSPGSGVIPVFGGSAVAPLSVPGTFMPTSGPNAGGVILQNTTPALSAASSLTGYLPYLVLGLGGIALLSVLKRR